MDHDRYQDWRRRLEAWLAEQPPAPAPPSAGDVKSALLAVLDQAHQVARGINATLAGVEVQDLNNYDFVAFRLDDLLRFEEFSLAEYSFVLGRGQRPGIRLLVQQGETAARVAVVLFEDVVQWRVDDQGRKISVELMSLDLSGPRPEAVLPESARDLFPAGADWRGQLTEAFGLPVLRYHQPEES